MRGSHWDQREASKNQPIGKVRWTVLELYSLGTTATNKAMLLPSLGTTATHKSGLLLSPGIIASHKSVLRPLLVPSGWPKKQMLLCICPCQPQEQLSLNDVLGNSLSGHSGRPYPMIFVLVVDHCFPSNRLYAWKKFSNRLKVLG